MEGKFYIDSNRYEHLIETIRNLDIEYSQLTEEEIIDKCEYHYGGNELTALTECIYNLSFKFYKQVHQIN